MGDLGRSRDLVIYSLTAYGSRSDGGQADDDGQVVDREGVVVEEEPAG